MSRCLTEAQKRALNYWRIGGRRGGTLGDPVCTISESGGSAVVLESFEGASISGTGTSMLVEGDLNWEGGGFSGDWLELSTDNATAGTNSLKMNAQDELYACYVTSNVGGQTVDLTGYSTLQLDITIETLTYASSVFTFGVQDAGAENFGSATTTAGQTGTFTLSIDLTEIADKSAMYFLLQSSVESGVANDYVWYADNLRAS